MKNKIIKMVFILLIVITCIITYGCKFSKNNGNHSCSSNSDSFTQIEDSEDTTDANSSEEIPFTESQDDKVTNSNNEIGEKSNEGDRRPNMNLDSEGSGNESMTSSESIDSSFIDESSNNKVENAEENVRIEETESDDRDEGIVLPDDEW